MKTKLKQNNANHSNRGNSLKKIAATTGAVLVGGLAYLYGIPAIYLGVSVGAIGAYQLYQERATTWFEKNQPLLLGGSLGFLYAGPLGMLAGGWLGHYINQKINAATQAVNHVVETVRPVTAPFSIANKTAKNVVGGLKKGYQTAANWLFNEGESPRVEMPEFNFNAPDIDREESDGSVMDNMLDLFGDFANNSENIRDVFDTATDVMGTLQSNVSWLWNKTRELIQPENAQTNESTNANKKRNASIH